MTNRELQAKLKQKNAEIRRLKAEVLALQQQLEEARREASLLRSAYAHLKDGQTAKAERLWEASRDPR